ncbi:MAG: dephospho-CoA kinase [Treponema sp.]|nr:dephospho-CoA kinase [Treponema sp.]
MKKIIGLTGTYCTGKNHVAALLENRGLETLDLDILGHEALEREKTAVCARFGEDIINSKGMIDRRLLGEKVFGDPEKLAALEAIVHPVVNQMTEQWISEQKTSCVIHAALIHKSSVFKRLDFIIMVNAPFVTRLRRAHVRDGLSYPVLLGRFARQKGFYPQYLSGKADIYRVENPGFPHHDEQTVPGVSSAAVQHANEKLEHRIDEILANEGILESWKRKNYCS